MWSELFRILFTGDQQAMQGPFVRYLNELEVTDNGITTVYVDTGAGMVNGHMLISSEKETWTIPAGPVGGRTDRVVMVENNSNVEVTQSIAGRPFLFPADLSEYTATPGVPAYSARLASLRGADTGALPALDQTIALYMVELARYDINNVPTISNQVDYREFCKFSGTIIDGRKGGHATGWGTPGTNDYVPVCGAVMIQLGAASWAGAAAPSGTLAITFPTPFSSQPWVMISGAGAKQVWGWSGLLAAGFTAKWEDWAGVNRTTTSCSWIAMGLA